MWLFQSGLYIHCASPMVPVFPFQAIVFNSVGVYSCWCLSEMVEIMLATLFWGRAIHLPPVTPGELSITCHVFKLTNEQDIVVKSVSTV